MTERYWIYPYIGAPDYKVVAEFDSWDKAVDYTLRYGGLIQRIWN